MVKEIVQYKCEICNRKYDSLNEAMSCENKYIEKAIVKVGDEMDYVMKVESFGMIECAFPLKVCSIATRGHLQVYYFDEYDRDEDFWYESTVLNYVVGNGNLKEKLSL